MPLFQYKAVSPAGEIQEGVLDAASQDGVITHLKTLGLIPIRAAEVSAQGVVQAVSGAATTSNGKAATWSLFSSQNVGQAELAIVTRELATLLKAGLPLDRSLEILINLAERERMRELLMAIRNEVRGGSSLSRALDQHRNVFTRFYVNMVKAGEVGGSLGGVLLRLADYMERAKELRDTVVSALIYPLFLLGGALVSICLILLVVVPQFKQIFLQSGAAISTATAALFSVSFFLRDSWQILIAVALGTVWLLSRSFQQPASKARWDRRMLGWGIIGKLIGRIEMARFARSLATLLENGVPLLSSMFILKETINNAVFRDALEFVARELKEGRGFAKPMLETNVFPKLAVQMISVGEETGKLSEMLYQVADVYDREVALLIKRALALLQPVLIIFLAGFIAGIMFLLLDPMLGMMDIKF
ncbi:MAG: type II secretion system F family protein [Burkholderiales bacterium]